MNYETEIAQAREEGYDIIFHRGNDVFAVKSALWNEQKASECRRMTGLEAFRETRGKRRLVFYDPVNWKLRYDGENYWLVYVGKSTMPEQPINASSMYKMFTETSTAQLDLSSWDMEAVMDAEYAFADNKNVQKICFGEQSMSNLEYAEGMFKGCANLTELDLSHWQMVPLRTISRMFSMCESLINLDVSGIDTSLVVDMVGVFENMKNLETLNLANWNIFCVKDLSDLCNGCVILDAFYAPSWAAQSVEHADRMFKGCASLVEIDIQGWNPILMVSAEAMFAGCQCLECLNLDYWKVFNLNKDLVMTNAWEGCGLLSEGMIHRYDAVSLLKGLIQQAKHDVY